MSKILRMSDRIKLKIGGVTFTLAPLNYLQKQEISNCTKNANGEEVFDLLKAQVVYIKYAVKDVDGIEDYRGNPYKPEMEGDNLTDDAVSEILNLDQRGKLTQCAWQLLNGVSGLVDLETGKDMEGVSIEVDSSGK